MTNILTIDLEDWHQLIRRRVSGNLSPASAAVARQVDALLELLERHRTQATFFTLGMLAEAYPNVVKRIAAQGHEIASHGYAHLPTHRLSRQEFTDDCKRAKALLEDLTGQPVRGYRAAEFSVRSRTLWVLEVLAELGFLYDSSIFPIRHRRYGIPGFAPRVVQYALRGGKQLFEIPLATVSLGPATIPVAGGGYFRLMPVWLIRQAMGKLHADQQPIVAYFHPYEFDSRPLDVFEGWQPSSWAHRLRGVRFNWHQNLGRGTMPGKLADLLLRHRFTSCLAFLQGAHQIERRALFSEAG